MLIFTGLIRNETNSEARQARKYIPLTQGGLHTSGLHRRHRACYGSRTEHEMMAGITPVHSAWSTAHNIIANTNYYYLSQRLLLLLLFIMKLVPRYTREKKFYLAAYCLLAMSRKNYWPDLHENFTRDLSVDMEELIKFWKSSASGFRIRNSEPRNFSKYSSPLQDRTFSTI